MNVELRVKQVFEAAHQLTTIEAPQECRQLHGHRYEVEVACAGQVHPQTGLLVTYEHIIEHLAGVIAQIDHSFINDSAPEMGEPTTEHMCRWFWMKLHRRGLVNLCEIRIQETANTCCVFRG